MSFAAAACMLIGTGYFFFNSSPVNIDYDDDNIIANFEEFANINSDLDEFELFFI